MSWLEPSNPTAVDPEKFNTAEAKDKDSKTAFVNMLEVLKEKINNLLKEIYEDINSGMKWRKLSTLAREVESIKKIQAEGKLILLFFFFLEDFIHTYI